MKTVLLVSLTLLFSCEAFAGGTAPEGDKQVLYREKQPPVTKSAAPASPPLPDVSLYPPTGRSLFVYETDTQSAADSLNRISGEIDTGFSTGSQSYESDSHYRPGPFGRDSLADRD